LIERVKAAGRNGFTVSWNEFSENSYIEPSQIYGDRYLQLMADIRLLPNTQVTDFDSSDLLALHSIVLQ
jgi:hypothetical protein